MQPLKVNKYVKALLIVGFAFTLVLLCVASYGAFTNTGDLLSYLLIPCLIPLLALMLAMVLYTKEVFQYAAKKRDQKVREFLDSGRGSDWTREDINTLRKEAARAWHPDAKDEDYREFANDILARINQIINEMDKQVRKNGHIDWENWHENT